MRTIRPYLEKIATGRDQGWIEYIGGILKDMALSALTLPDDLKRYLDKANAGELEIRVKGLQESANLIYAMGHQILYGIFAMVAGTLSYVSYTRGEVTIFYIAISVAGFFAICLAGSMLASRKWRKRP